MTKKHFQAMANMVRAILDGKWTHEAPSWADSRRYWATEYRAVIRFGNEDDYTRAVQTAEAFIILVRAFNPLFDERRFLIACGLLQAPTKRKR